jgi:hypothetical protein
LGLLRGLFAASAGRIFDFCEGLLRLELSETVPI